MVFFAQMAELVDALGSGPSVRKDVQVRVLFWALLIKRSWFVCHLLFFVLERPSMNKEILRLAVPNIISNISVPLLSTVDTALMGRLTEVHIGAVGVGAMIFNFIYWNFGFLRMGTTGITAQAFGRQNDQQVADTLGRAFLVVLSIALLLLMLQVPIREASVWLMNVSGEQQLLVERYFTIRIWAAPASLGLYAAMGWFFGMQNAIFPLILTIAINVINIVLSYFLVYQLGWEVEGVAWGTLIAQYFGFLLAIGLFFYRYRRFSRLFHRKAILLWKELRRFLSINADIFIRTLCLTFVFGFFYSQSSAEGAMILAVNTILMQFLNWMSYGVDGFAFAAEALVGKYAGAEDQVRTRRAVRLSFIWGMGLAVLFSLLYGLGGPALLRLFTNQADVIQATLPFLFWMVLLPIIGTPSYIWDGVFIGLTASKSMRNSMILALLVFLLVYTITPAGSNHALWLSMLAFLAARGLFQYGLFAWKGIELR
jgi:MATE family multidrug resistance protein